MIETVVLTIPAAHDYRPVASLVLGGLGSRLDLSYERTDDLQLAVLSVLEAASDDSVTLELGADGGSLSISIGPLRDGVGADPALTRVLGRLVHGAEETRRDGRPWLELRLPLPSAS